MENVDNNQNTLKIDFDAINKVFIKKQLTIDLLKNIVKNKSSEYASAERNLYTFLSYYDDLGPEIKESYKTFLISCLAKMVEDFKPLNSLIIVTKFGITPPYPVGRDYYNLQKKYEFILLCFEKWCNTDLINEKEKNVNEAILSYYLGGAAYGLSIFDKKIIPENNFLSAKELYYYCLMSKIVDIDFEKRADVAISTIKEEESEAQYYKGLIYLLKENKYDSLECFSMSDDLENSSTILNGDINKIRNPSKIQINPYSDSIDVLNDFIRFQECRVAFEGVNATPAIFRYFEGDTELLEEALKSEKANELSKLMYADLYGRNIELTEEEYKKRENYFKQRLLNEDGFARDLALATEKGIKELPINCTEHQISLTIKMFTYKNAMFYANLIYYYYFKKQINIEALIDLSYYVIYVAKKELRVSFSDIASGTAISLITLNFISPHYDFSLPIKELIEKIPDVLIPRTDSIQPKKSEYLEFKKRIANRRLELQLSMGKDEFSFTFRYMTIIDKLKQIDEYLKKSDFEDPFANQED